MIPATYPSIHKTKEKHEMTKAQEKERGQTEIDNGLSPEKREIVLAFMDKYDKTLKALSK